MYVHNVQDESELRRKFNDENNKRTSCQYANFVLSFSLPGKKEAIDKIRRNSVRNEALNDFLRSISDFCDRLSSVSSLPLSSI